MMAEISQWSVDFCETNLIQIPYHFKYLWEISEKHFRNSVIVGVFESEWENEGLCVVVGAMFLIQFRYLFVLNQTNFTKPTKENSEKHRGKVRGGRWIWQWVNECLWSLKQTKCCSKKFLRTHVTFTGLFFISLRY